MADLPVELAEQFRVVRHEKHQSAAGGQNLAQRSQNGPVIFNVLEREFSSCNVAILNLANHDLLV
jgi:hypothetical protein